MNASQAYKILDSRGLISKDGQIVCPASYAYLVLKFEQCSCFVPSKENGDLAPAEIREHYAHHVKLIDQEILEWDEAMSVLNVGFDWKETQWVVLIDSLECLSFASFRSMETVPIMGIEFL